MRNPPAFQFYADDFLAGTLDLSQSEVGAYIRLLCHQWSRGSIPVETEKQQRLAGGSVSDDVAAKFRLQQDGKLVNERLERERQKQTDYREMQRQKGILSAESRKNQPKTNHGSTEPVSAVTTETQPNGQPEVNSPSPSPSPSPSANSSKASKPAPTIEEVIAHAESSGGSKIEAEKFWYYYDSNGWRVGRNPMKSWKSSWGLWHRKNLPSENKSPSAFNQPVIQKMDLKTKIKLLEEQIASHPANHEFIGSSDCPTDAQRADLKRRRADLESAKNQLSDLL